MDKPMTNAEFAQIIEKHVALQEIARHAGRLNDYWRNHGALQVADQIGLDGRLSKIYPMDFDYGDPATRQHNSKGETDIDTLSKFGIRLMTKTSQGRKFDLMEQVRQMLLPRSDGKPALLIARNTPNMDHVIQVFSGAYAYREIRPGADEQTRPHKDGWYDHIADSIQYLIDNASPIVYGSPADEADPEWWKEKDGYGVGNEF